MISQDKFFGESREISSAVDVTLSRVLGKLNMVTMTTTSKKVKAEDARNFPKAGDVAYWVTNEGSNSFDVANNGGTSLGTVAAGQVAEMLLLDRSTANGSWAVKVRTPQPL